jgi:type 1 glutamine amidotransferase
VFYSSFGHREDIFADPKVKSLLLGGIAWALGNVDADIPPNIRQVTPQAEQLHL